MGTKERNITPTHKVGIKLFTEPQLENVFPDYKNLLNRVENHRKNIVSLGEYRQKHYQYNLMYDNVFSIMGKRGTGKTSVAFTLQKMIEEDEQHPYDVILPIIIPEMIPQDCSALGWLLAIVKQRIQEFEQQGCPTRQGNAFGSGFWCNCKLDDGKEKSLSAKVDKLEELSFSVKYNPANESSYHVAVGNSARQAQGYYQFAQLIAELWDEWVLAIRSGYGQEDGPVCPLIYFIFDDVDLAPEKVSELLSIIIKYLSHPNVIVITTADEEMFLEVIENNLDKEIGRIPKEWRSYLKHGTNEQVMAATPSQKSMDLISQTARLYMGKVMPTSTRYYLKLFGSAEQKCWFRLSDDRSLGEEMRHLVDELIAAGGDEERQADKYKKLNFLESDGRTLSFYFHYLGNTSRQIANAYLGAQEFIQSLIRDAGMRRAGQMGEEEYLDTVFNNCHYFLHMAIQANHDLAENIDDTDQFIDSVFRYEHNEWRMYIDYSYLYAYLGYRLTRDSEEEDSEIMQMALALYSLLLFVENLLLLLEQCTKEGITGRRKVHGIRGLTSFISSHSFHGKQMFRRDLDTKTFFSHYGTLLNRVRFLGEDRMANMRFNIEYFYDFVDFTYADKDLDVYMIRHLFKESREWFGEMAGALSLVYGNIYLIGKKEMENCRIYLFEKNLCGYQSAISNIIQEAMKSCLAFDSKAIAEGELTAANEQLKIFHSSKPGFGLFCKQVYEEMTARQMGEIRERMWEESGQDDLPEAVDEEEVYKSYLSESAVSLANIIREIDRECADLNLVGVMERCQEDFASDISERFAAGIQNQDELRSLLKVQYEYISKWDYKEHNLYLQNHSKFVETAYAIGEMSEVFGAFNEIADTLSSFHLNDYDIGMDLAIQSDTLYNEIKGVMNGIGAKQPNADILPVYGGSQDFWGKVRFEPKLQVLLKNLDVAVDLEKRAEFEDAVSLGLMVQLSKRIQKLYVYQTIKEHHSLGYNLSSSKIEHMTVRRGSKRGKKWSDKYSYYYQLFQTMGKILEDKLDKAAIEAQMASRYPKKSEEERHKLVRELEMELPLMKTYIARCSSHARNVYIDQLWKEVKHEPISD